MAEVTEETQQPAAQEPAGAPVSVAMPSQPNPEPEIEAETEATITPEELDQLRAQEVAFAWQASEYVHHQKDKRWYFGLAGIVLVLVVISALFKYWLEIAVFLVMGAAVAVYARKPPRVLAYELTQNGISVDGRQYPYKEFRSFSVMPDESWHTIDLEPVKRFSPRLAILFDESDLDEIVGHLQLHLPEVDRLPDPVERITRFLRF